MAGSELSLALAEGLLGDQGRVTRGRGGDAALSEREESGQGSSQLSPVPRSTPQDRQAGDPAWPCAHSQSHLGHSHHPVPSHTAVPGTTHGPAKPPWPSPAWPRPHSCPGDTTIPPDWDPHTAGATQGPTLQGGGGGERPLSLVATSWGWGEVSFSPLEPCGHPCKQGASPCPSLQTRGLCLARQGLTGPCPPVPHTLILDSSARGHCYSHCSSFPDHSRDPGQEGSICQRTTS